MMSDRTASGQEKNFLQDVQNPMTDYAACALARRADTHLSCHRLNVALLGTFDDTDSFKGCRFPRSPCSLLYSPGPG